MATTTILEHYHTNTQNAHALPPCILYSRCDNFWDGTPSFPPPCDDCKSRGGMGSSTVARRDMVKIPADLTAGKYVLGWRYDCEATAQVWSNCADITVV